MRILERFVDIPVLSDILFFTGVIPLCLVFIGICHFILVTIRSYIYPEV